MTKNTVCRFISFRLLFIRVRKYPHVPRVAKSAHLFAVAADNALDPLHTQDFFALDGAASAEKARGARASQSAPPQRSATPPRHQQPR
jgi:hypothetical protein